MISEEFCALPDGSVPSILYNSIKGDTYCDTELQSMLERSVSKGTDDAYYMLEAKRNANLEYLSKADIKVLNKSLSENANLPYGELCAKSYGKEWKRVYHLPGIKVMNVIGMAKDAKVSDDMLEYIKENLAIEEALA